MTRAACLLAVTLALIGSGAAYSRSQAKPTTLVYANGQIVAFAQDGNQIAWASTPDSPPPRCTGEVRIRLLDKHRQKVITPASGFTCHDEYGFGSETPGPGFFVLAGRRALWKTEYCGNYCHVQLTTGWYSAKNDEMLFPDSDYERYFYDYNWDTGDYLTGAGDSSTIVYGVAEVGLTGPPYCEEDLTCTLVISGGSVNRVVGTSTVTVPGAPPPFIMAASGRRIALVVAESAGAFGAVIGPGSPAHVVVIDAVTGGSVGSFTPLGRPQAIAFSTSAVGVLVSVSGEKQIEFHSPAGTLIRSVVVPTGATGLSMSGTKAVFRVGKSIRIVGITSGTVRLVTTAAATPMGLSIEGTRVAWAENVTVNHRKRGRVRAITVR